jgi:hypothetical protein
MRYGYSFPDHIGVIVSRVQWSHRLWSCSRNRAWNPPTSSSLAKEKRLRSLLLSTAVRDFPTFAARAFSLAPNPVIGRGLPMSDHA